MPVKRFVVLAAISAVVLTTLALAANKSEKSDGLEQQVAALERKVEAQQAALEKLISQRFDALSKKLDEHYAALEKKVAEAAKNPEEEAAAMVAQINRAVQAGRYDEAKGQMTELQRKYARTQSAQRARSLQRELEVFGKTSPRSLGVEKWYQGDANLQNGKTTLLVFWEIWCPHCKREVPKLQTIYDRYRDQGLQVVGLTKLSKNATEEQVRDFIKGKNVSYPMAKENGEASAYFNVSSIPAAAVVKDGKIVWRGHPARLTETMLKKWL